MVLLDPLWDELIEHNQVIRHDLRHRTSSRLVDTTYGSMGRTSRLRRSQQVESTMPTDQVDAAGASASAEFLTATDEQATLLQVH